MIIAGRGSNQLSYHMHTTSGHENILASTTAATATGSSVGPTNTGVQA